MSCPRSALCDSTALDPLSTVSILLFAMSQMGIDAKENGFWLSAGHFCACFYAFGGTLRESPALNSPPTKQLALVSSHIGEGPVWAHVSGNVAVAGAIGQ